MCKKHDFGGLEVLTKYDGIFLDAIDPETNILYQYAFGGVDEPYIYNAFDFSSKPELLQKYKHDIDKLDEIIIKEKIPFNVVHVVNYDGSGKFSDFLVDAFDIIRDIYKRN